jgi:transcriptional regulator with XRE-family HTH domain
LTLHDARKLKGLSQKELADLVGVTVVAISRYENGHRSPKMSVAKRMEMVLDVPWYQLVDNKGA